ncbi:MAG: TRAP transporter small permease subunit [Paracoccaceae bacterium]
MVIFATIHRAMERVSTWAVWIGGFGLLLCALMIAVEVVGRKLGGLRISGTDEYSGYVFAGATVWAYAYCLIHRSHIRIDALYNVVSPRMRAVMDVLGLSLLGFYISFFTLKAWGVFLESWEKNSVSVTPELTPLWIPQIFWVTGLTFFTIVTLFLIAYTLILLLSGQIGAVQRLAGTMSIQEEMAEETRGVKELGK